MNISSKLIAARNVVTSKAGRQVLTLQKHSPTIMFGAGVVGVVATVVLASKATLELDDVLNERDETMAEAAHVHATQPDRYTDASYKSDLVKINVKTALKISKLYGPSFVVGVVSVGCLTGAHLVLTRRNAGLLAAYAAVSEGFKEYRERVLADVGPEKEREYYMGTEEVEVYSEKKNGEPVVTRVKRSAGRSPYARLFDERNPNHNPEGTHNVFFLRAAQASLQNDLNSKGWVTLNDALDQLGMSRTKAGMVVGWVKDSPKSDQHVDFGIWDDDRMEEFHDFVTNREGAIWLDFNVTPIHDLI